MGKWRIEVTGGGAQMELPGVKQTRKPEKKWRKEIISGIPDYKDALSCLDALKKNYPVTQVLEILEKGEEDRWFVSDSERGMKPVVETSDEVSKPHKAAGGGY